ncbi:hypothetical protein AABD38_07175 [Staphylococcus nepalensis]
MAFSIQQWGAINGLIHMNYSQRMYEAPAGVTTTVSRLASTLSTFFFPMILANYGLSLTMYIFFITIIYWFYTIIEYGARNKRKNLEETSAI